MPELPDVTKHHLNERKLTRYHLGCGKIFLKGWLNIGYWTHLESGGLFDIDGATLLNHDLRFGIPAEEGTLEAVYHSHLLEHLSYPDALELIARIHKAMKPGGLHRILVPDLEAFAKAYLTPGSVLMEKYREHVLQDDADIYQTPASVFMGMLHNHEHKWGWDWETLKWALERQGFKQIRRTLFQESDFKDIDSLEQYAPLRCLESLCVECYR